jgi:hypothetical protein
MKWQRNTKLIWQSLLDDATLLQQGGRRADSTILFTRVACRGHTRSAAREEVCYKSSQAA